MKLLPKSIRKNIRKKKARIRREVSDIKEQKEMIDEIYRKLQPASGESKH